MIALVVAAFVADAAHAADRPAFGPPPPWVKPVAIPDPPAKPDDAPLRILLSDNQVAFEPGRETVYTQIAVQLQTPQGLAAGNVSLPWRPETDTLTVHKLQVRRGAETIDVLAGGQTFTILRREQNLESATLDGVLTANIQPEGLQVGDILVFAATLTSSDPTLRGHVEQVAMGWNDAPVTAAHLRAQWPSSMALRMRQTGSLPVLKPAGRAGITAVELSLTDVRPYVVPKGAPRRFGVGRMIEFSDYASWADLARLMAPLYDAAAIVPAQGPLRAELDRIRALSSDPVRRAEAALALVQDRIRYVALAMGAGGYVPADAATTWSRRFGDCKAKTALLIALLQALDIKAEPVAVNAGGGDGLDARRPMVGAFNHVLVRASIGDRTYWLDGTRTGDTALARLRVPNFGWGLPFVAKDAALVRMVPPPLDAPTVDTAIQIDARAGLNIPAPARIETILHDDAAIATNAAVANLSGETRDRALRDYWRERFDTLDVRSTSATFDAARGELRLVVDGVAKMDWSRGWYETDETAIGWKADFSRDPGPDRDAPFAVAYPFYNRTSETILLPAGFAKAKTSVASATDIDRTIAGVAYVRRTIRTGDGVVIEKSARSVAPEFAAAEAPAAQAALRALADQALYIRVPANYRPNDAELDTMLATKPDNVEKYLARGYILMANYRFKDALADFEAAATLEPRNVEALANRGLARVWLDDPAAAADLDRALAIDPRSAVALRGRAWAAHREGRNDDAVTAYTTALAVEPDNAFALGHRAEAHRAIGNDDAALRDAAAALKLDPTWISLYLLRANAFRAHGRREEALLEAAAVEAAVPDVGYAHVVAAKIYAAFGRKDDAAKAFDRALAIKPESYVYLNRAVQRPADDLAGRRADLDAALRLDPGNTDALAAKADVLAKTGDTASAIAGYDRALVAKPGDATLLTGRGIVYAKAGDAARATADFTAARAGKPDASQLNEMCWIKATAGVALESALADCEAAVTGAKARDIGAHLDSLALVKLRLGRFDEAISDYDRALSSRPRQTGSLFGRALARARKGDRTGAATDMDAAPAINPDVRTEFAGYGVTIDVVNAPTPPAAISSRTSTAGSRNGSP